MEKIHKNIRVFMLSCIKHACFHVFSPFSAYFSPHDIIAEKGLLHIARIPQAIVLAAQWLAFSGEATDRGCFAGWRCGGWGWILI